MPLRRCSASRLRVARGVSRGDRPVFSALRGVCPAGALRSQGNGPNRKRPLKGTRPPVYRRDAGLGRHRTYSWPAIARRRGRARPSVLQFGESPRTTPSRLPVSHRSWCPNGGAGHLKLACPVGRGKDVAVPKPCPEEFREDVVRVARNRGPGVTVEQVAADFGVHAMTLWKRMRRADIDDGIKPGTSSQDSAELREARRQIKLLEQENEVLRRAAAYLSQANLPERIYPLVKEPAVVVARRGCATGDQVAPSTLPHRRPVRVPG